MADMETCDGCGIGFLQFSFERDDPLEKYDLCPRCKSQGIPKTTQKGFPRITQHDIISSELQPEEYVMTEFDINRDTQTSAIEARFKDGKLIDNNNIDKLILALLDQRDWHQDQTVLNDLVISRFEKRIKMLEEICESYYNWEWGPTSTRDETPKAFLLKQWYEEFKNKEINK